MPKIIALIGDYNKAITAHRAIPQAIEITRRVHRLSIDAVWIDTNRINNCDLETFDGF